MKKVVIKIGTSLLTDTMVGVNLPLISSICDVVLELSQHGYKCLIVSSGSIGLGCHRLGWNERPNDIIQKQAAASVGQILLAQAYEKCFAQKHQIVGQVLLTRRGMQDLERYINARLTLNELMNQGVIPIINENDVIADDEIRFSDNDYLAAMVAEMVVAEHLFILTDIDGLYTDNPNENPLAEHVSVVDEVTPDIEKLAGKPSQWGTGGMYSKIQAAKMATSCGTTVHIVSGDSPSDISRVLLNNESKGTKFLTSRTPVSAKESWIAYAMAIQGQLYITKQGVENIKNSKQLKVENIEFVQKNFGRGAVVEIIFNGSLIAKGVSIYSSDALQSIKGCADQQIYPKLGYTYGDAAVYCEDLVVLTG